MKGIFIHGDFSNKNLRSNRIETSALLTRNNDREEKTTQVNFSTSSFHFPSKSLAGKLVAMWHNDSGDVL
jgi:hypothetical protein